MFVAGQTTPYEITIVSTVNPFVADEYVKIHDSNYGELIGEVIETNSIPQVTEPMFVNESGIIESLKVKQVYKPNTTLHMAKVKLLEELQEPITPLSDVSRPDFSDIERLLVKTTPENGFTVGVIRGTEKLQKELPAELSSISPLFDSSLGVTEQKGLPFILDYYSLREYPHIGMFGGSGSGKTFGLRVLCEEIMRKKIPGIVMDPHFELSFHDNMKGIPADFQEDFSKQHDIFQIGVNVGINFSELKVGELITLIEFVGSLSEPMRSAIEELHRKNDSFQTLIARVKKLLEAFQYHEKTPRDQQNLPNLSEEQLLLFKKFQTKIAGIPTLTAIAWRLESLNKTGIFNCDVSQVEASMLKRKLAVIRGDQRHLVMLASYLVKKVYKQRRAHQDHAQKGFGRDQGSQVPPKFPPFFVIMDESHQFAPNSNYSSPTKLILREIAQEGRKYGTFLVLGTQRPSGLDETITAQLNTKFIFRTNMEADMKTIQTETNLNEKQMKRLPDMASGNAFVSSATLDKTFYIRFRTTKTVSPHASHPFDELEDFGGNDKLREALILHLPISTTTLPMKHSDINRTMGKAIDQKEIFETLDELTVERKVVKKQDMFGKVYEMA